MFIVIPGNVIAKKNSERIGRFKKAGKWFQNIRPSAAYERWEKAALQELLLKRVQPWPGPYPVELQLTFYRKTRQPFDLSNMIEGVQDVLQKAGVIAEDNMLHVVPVIDRIKQPMGWAVDKDHPRTEITIKAIYKEVQPWINQEKTN